jgi:alkaline phosphatase
MKRISIIFLLVFFTIGFIIAQNKPIKNVILLIPDGTSLPAVSAARWYQRYNHPEITHLNLDPYICGTILTYCSNAPIGDSAPTTSCYMTGHPSITGFVSTYPVADPKNDIVPSDPNRSYQPMMTLLEAARLTQNKSTGLVFTCEFPHATPADCSAHSYDRSKYEWIVPQMVHNKLDVVIGGGSGILTEDHRQFLRNEGYGLFLDDVDGFRNYKGNRMWALFGDKDMSYDIDRDTLKEPSLAEMAKVAINKLSRNKNGFFLMIEGSKVDWAAHANDPVALITDMIAFDRACGVAFDFAKQNEETVVIVVPDHGNSGFSIGSSKCRNYSKQTKDELFETISGFKTSISGLITKLHNTNPVDLRKVVFDLTGVSLSDDEYTQLLQCADYNLSTLSDEERMKGSRLTKTVGQILDKYHCFGFTTTGHTGEEVFLAVYDPTGQRLTGHHSNIELHQYLYKTMGLKQNLDSLSNHYFARHTDVFGAYACNIDTLNGSPVLEVRNEKHKLEIRPYTNIVKYNEKEIQLSTVIVYVDKNNTFYLPQYLKDLLVAK